jgi:hypothetical protein
MVHKRRPFYRFSLAVGLKLALFAAGFALIHSPQIVQAQGIPQTWTTNKYEPPRGIGSANRVEGGATRSPGVNCPIADKPLTALMPSDRFGTTVAAYPSFFVYLPASANPGTSLPVEFVLEDSEGNLVYQSKFLTNGKSGIITLDLPQDVSLSPLKVGEDYRWMFSILCPPENERSNDQVVEGWVRRVAIDPTLETQLAQASPTKKVELYAEAELWQDTLAQLVELRRNYPSDSEVANQWVKLLNAAGLSNLVGESLASQNTPVDVPLSSSQP